MLLWRTEVIRNPFLAKSKGVGRRFGVWFHILWVPFTSSIWNVISAFPVIEMATAFKHLMVDGKGDNLYKKLLITYISHD